MYIQDVVSIVVPVYNGEQFLHESIESILSQTYTNLEIICVCAGCTDASVEIIQKYVQKDQRLILHVEQENHGPAGSRNIGMEMAKGEWIIFLDCDDLFEPDMIEIMLNHAVMEHADICCCFWDCFDEQLPGKICVKYEKIKEYCDTYPIISVPNERKHIFQTVAYNVWSKLIHRTVYQKEFVNFGNFPSSEDFYFSLIAATEVTKIVYVDQVLVHYRNNISRNTQTTMMCTEKSYQWEVLDAVYQHIAQKEYEDQFKQSFYNCVCESIFVSCNYSVSVYRQVFNELHDIYLKKWGMEDRNILEKLSYFNRVICTCVWNGDTKIQETIMRIEAKVRFVKDMAERGTCALWGCGYLGQVLLEKLKVEDIEIQHIFDSDRDKLGMKICGQTIEQFQGENIDSIIVTSPRYYGEIKDQIGNCAGRIYNLEKEIFRY